MLGTITLRFWEDIGKCRWIWEEGRRWREKKPLRMRDINREDDRMEARRFNLCLLPRKLSYPDPRPLGERRQLTRPTTWGRYSCTRDKWRASVSSKRWHAGMQVPGRRSTKSSTVHQTLIRCAVKKSFHKSGSSKELSSFFAALSCLLAWLLYYP